MTRRWWVVIVAFVLLVAAACGQYPGVHQRGVALGETGAGTGALGGTDTGIGGGGATTGPGITGGAGPGGGTSGASPAEAGGGSSIAAGPGGGDATGVTANSITIGIHAPITGAAPVTNTSFSEGKDLYWKYGANGGPVKIFGRSVNVIIEDDQYNPSHAQQVCKEMAEQKHAFLLVGGAGTDQIVACAQYAAGQGIPYLSAGVAEAPLRSLSNYFAVSMTYPQQSPLLADYIKHVLHVTDASRVAAVVTDTPNFDDAVAAFTQSFPGVTVMRPPKNDHGESWGAKLCTGTIPNYDVVFPLVAPVFYLEMAGAAKCNPQYAGVGISMGIDEVAQTACRVGATKAKFFSPAPAFANSNQYDPAFRSAAAKAGVQPDDIMWLLWGLSKTLHQLLLKAGQNLTREGFIASTSNATVTVRPYPPLRYSSQDHFGASQVSVLKEVCSGGSGYYTTESAFRSSF